MNRGIKTKIQMMTVTTQNRLLFQAGGSDLRRRGTFKWTRIFSDLPFASLQVLLNNYFLSIIASASISTK